MRTVIDVLGWALLVAGAAWMLLSAIGLHRMHTPLARMQVAGKAATFGVGACLLGAALLLDDPAGSGKLVLTAVVLGITVPAGTQMLASEHHRLMTEGPEDHSTSR